MTAIWFRERWVYMDFNMKNFLRIFGPWVAGYNDCGRDDDNSDKLNNWFLQHYDR